MITKDTVEHISDLAEESKNNLKIVKNLTDSFDADYYSSRCNEIAREAAYIAQQSHSENSEYDEEITRYYISICITAFDSLKAVRNLAIKETKQ